ncbi:MAG: hypothetical protein ACKO5K_15920 [Armatimonadota bacterium]
MTDGFPLLAGTVWFVLAAAAAAVFHRERERTATRGSSLVWAAFAGLLVALAFLALTNIGNELVDDLRRAARTEGWYMARRPLQAKVVGAATVVVIAGYAWSLIRLGPRIRRYGMVMTAFAWLAGYTAIRTISLHHIDVALGMRLGPVSLGSALNLAGAALAALTIGRGWMATGDGPSHPSVEARANRSR